jgi:hypothetical protein
LALREAASSSVLASSTARGERRLAIIGESVDAFIAEQRQRLSAKERAHEENAAASTSCLVYISLPLAATAEARLFIERGFVRLETTMQVQFHDLRAASAALLRGAESVAAAHALVPMRAAHLRTLFPHIAAGMFASAGRYGYDARLPQRGLAARFQNWILNGICDDEYVYALVAVAGADESEHLANTGGGGGDDVAVLGFTHFRAARDRATPTVADFSLGGVTDAASSAGLGALLLALTYQKAVECGFSSGCTLCSLCSFISP